MYRVGIDVGGTFTDFTITDGAGRVVAQWKEDSDKNAPSAVIMQGLETVAGRFGVSLDEFLTDVSHIVHGSTIATNTVVQRNGPKVGLVCTEGFRDILRLRDGFKWDRYDLRTPIPKPFVSRHLTLGVRERIDRHGQVVVPLDEETVRSAADTFGGAGVEVVAVALLWSVANPVHEQRIRELFEDFLPEVPVVLSNEVLPEVREWERTSATVLSAYNLPSVEGYLRDFEQRLAARGFERRPQIMLANGGCASVDRAIAHPVALIGSGPAAGPSAAAFHSSANGRRDILVMDMGGTSFDVCLIHDGRPSMSRHLYVDHQPVGVQGVEVHSIGAGGGSIGWVDSGGALRVGPKSAGADPGPACYDFGGTEPTVTDANLVLGRLSSDAFLGGRRSLSRPKAERAVASRIAGPLGVDVVEAAAGVLQVVNANMVQAARVISIERGIDPRGCMLFCGGGAGGLHAGSIARDLGTPLVAIPLEASTLCAFGMTVTDVRHDYARSLPMILDERRLDSVRTVLEELEDQATAELEDDGFRPSEISIARFVDARYHYQIHEMTIPVPDGDPGDRGFLPALMSNFHSEHRRLFNYSTEDHPVEALHWRVVGSGRGIDKARAPPDAAEPGTVEPAYTIRPVYFDEIGGFADTRIYREEDVEPGSVIDGPAIVESDTTTIVVYPGQELSDPSAEGLFLLHTYAPT